MDLKSKTVKLIWESDFSKLVTETYGKPYRFQQQGDMMGQDTIYKFSIPDANWLPTPEDAARDIATWLNDSRTFKYEFEAERECYPVFESVIVDLHERGIIVPGDYALHVWW